MKADRQLGPSVRELLRGRKPGKCFCGRKAHTWRGRISDTCGRLPCLNRWRKAYNQDRRGEPILIRGGAYREVVAVRPHPSKPRWRVLVLSCGHEEEMPQSTALHRDRKRRSCARCGQAQDALVARLLAEQVI